MQARRNSSIDYKETRKVYYRSPAGVYDIRQCRTVWFTIQARISIICCLLLQYCSKAFLALTPAPEVLPAVKKELPKGFPRAKVIIVTNRQKDHFHHLTKSIPWLSILRQVITEVVGSVFVHGSTRFVLGKTLVDRTCY